MLDARLSAGLPSHPKTKKLLRRLGPAAGWSFVCLILWTRVNRPDGDLAGMSTEDIELAADWAGESDAFARELVSVGFLDGTESAYVLHDWAEHQPWSAGAEARSDKARWAALCKQHGRIEAARLMPEYAKRLLEASQKPDAGRSEDATGMPLAVLGGATSTPVAGSRSAPSPSPSPSPTPTLDTPPAPQGGGGKGSLPGEGDLLFMQFWLAYPRKTGRADAWKAWQALKVDAGLLAQMLAGLARWKVHPRWVKDGGQFVKTPGPWLRQKLWTDEEVCGPGTALQASAPQGEVPAWVKAAGFDTEADAHNRMCWEHNAHEFRDGERIAQGVGA